MDTLALTDRDGTYGAVKFARACYAAGIRPVLGVELAHRPALAGSCGRPGPGPRCAAARSASRSAAGCRGSPSWRRPTAGQAVEPAGRRCAGWSRPPTSPASAACRSWIRRHSPTTYAGRWLTDTCWCCSARPPSWLGPRSAHRGTPRRPRPGRARPLARARAAHPPPGRAGLPPAPGRRGLGRHLGPGHLPARRPDGRDGPPGRARRGADQRRPLRRPPRRRHRRRPRRGPAPGGTRPAARRPRQRRGLPQVRQGDGRGRRGGLPGSAGPGASATPSGRRSGCSPTPARSPTGARSTRAATWGWARCTSRSSSSPRITTTRTWRCAPAARARSATATARSPRQWIWKRLDDELEMIRGLGYASYFLTVGDVTDLIREMGVRCAARGSGAGSLVNYLLGVSGVDPIRHGLLMERFLSPLRAGAARHRRRRGVRAPARGLRARSSTSYGGERCVCVSMMDTYRVRHAVRDVGAALGMPPGETDTIAKAFPHIRARDARAALRELPELRASGLDRCPARPDVPARRAARRAAPPHRHAPVRGAALRRHPARPHAGRGQLRGLPDEPVRQGRRRGPRPAQARRARHPDAVLDGPRGRRDQAGRRASRSTSTTRRRCPSTTRRPTP